MKFAGPHRDDPKDRQDIEFYPLPALQFPMDYARNSLRLWASEVEVVLVFGMTTVSSGLSW